MIHEMEIIKRRLHVTAFLDLKIKIIFLKLPKIEHIKFIIIWLNSKNDKTYKKYIKKNSIPRKRFTKKSTLLF